MELAEKTEEILETLWIRSEEKDEETLHLSELRGMRKAVEQLLKADYISMDGDLIRITDRGKPVARAVVRRHRLAERLLADVLGTGGPLIHEKACKFEHLLDRGLDKSICILLGHPRVCPHGRPIPPGKCCREQQSQVQKVVSPLSQMSRGQRGKVAYIHAPEARHLQKLMAMGILPGAPVRLIQNFPSYVFQICQSQFAVDKEIAGTIFIRLIDEQTE